MKRIEAIIRPTKVGKVCAALEKVGHVGHRISQIEGGSHDGHGHLLRGKTYRADLMIMARVEVIVKDRESDRIVKAIRDAVFTGDAADGDIYVHAMNEAIRIGTGENGEAAL